jgi:hypothetical protein
MRSENGTSWSWLHGFRSKGVAATAHCGDAYPVRLVRLALVWSILVGVGGVAEAQTAAPPARDWYGYQTLIVDALSCSLLVYGVASSNADATYGGYAAYLLGAPIVHLAHEQAAPLLGSLGLRLIVPVVFLGLVALANGGDSHSGDSRADPAFNRTLIGLGLAIPVAIDAAFLAWKERPVDGLALRVRVDPRTSAAAVTVQGEL